MQIEFNRKDNVGLAVLTGSLNAVTVDTVRSEFKTWFDGQTDGTMRDMGNTLCNNIGYTWAEF